VKIAMHKFALDERVVATKRGHDNGCWINSRHVAPGGPFGRVVGFGSHPWMVRVLRDGLKTPETYHMAFWKPHQTGIEPK
jgi:hypothetical protein